MSRLQLKILVFVSGATVMAVEMTALRLLAPFFGTSLLITTILIGSMMGFLSLGYWLGGKYGDKHPTLPALAKVTAAASVLVLAIPFLGQPILRGASAAMRPLLQGEALSEPTVAFAMIVGGLLGTIGLIAFPITLLGMVSPWAVRLAVDDVEEAGKAAGQLYALSTFGSIIGSFLPALALVPLLGVRNTFLAVGVTLLAVSAFCMVKRGPGLGGAAALVLLGFIPEGIVRPMDGLVEESESLYHFIQVVIEPYGKCEEAYHLYLNEGVGVHSVKCLDETVETRGTWAYMAAAPLYMDEPAAVDDVLIIGLAGGTIARQLLESFPTAHVDGVEIDGAVVEVGKKYFDNDDDRITPFVMDGRIYLQNTPKTYDVILMDAYRQPYIPFHLTTVEFWQTVSDHLEPDGVVGINVASVRGVSQGLAQMIYRTMREVFPSVHYVDATQSNDILYATNSLTHKDRIAEHLAELPAARGLDQIRSVIKQKTVGEVEGWEDGRVLTDDQAPVEMVWDLMALEYAG
ncbi:MAG: spermine synthase [Proteobacteria bacterium]|nr:spermine synthase [Pseudomonadota bacterium]MCP4918930.1 spermine synthase [Pseudomonadota bacterium]